MLVILNGRKSMIPWDRHPVVVQTMFRSAREAQLMSRVRRILAACVFLVLSTGACDWFEDPSPDMIRITLEGNGARFMVITSTEFFATSDEQGALSAQIFAADTSFVTLPFDRNWNIKEDQRFYMVGIPVDSANATVRVQVFVDEDQEIDDTVEAGPENPVRYMYLFNQHVLVDYELL
jgi:hypothetical protein